MNQQAMVTVIITVITKVTVIVTVITTVTIIVIVIVTISIVMAIFETNPFFFIAAYVSMIFQLYGK